MPGDLSTRLCRFELGASDFVPKPFSLDELIARRRVAHRLRKKLGRQAPIETVRNAGYRLVG